MLEVDEDNVEYNESLSVIIILITVGMSFIIYGKLKQSKCANIGVYI